MTTLTTKRACESYDANQALAVVTIPNDDKPTSQYCVTKRKLGEGAFSKVYYAYHWDPKRKKAYGKPVVAKMFKTAKSFREDEAYIQNACYNNVLTVCRIDSNNENSEEKICIFSEYFSDTTLAFYLQEQKDNLKIADRVHIAYQIATQIQHLHSVLPEKRNAIIHGDLKETNFLIKADPKTKKFDVRIIDFGLSIFTDDPSKKLPTQRMGSFGYMPPEISAENNPFFGVKSDIYSLTRVILTTLNASDPGRNKRLERYRLKEQQGKQLDEQDKKEQQKEQEEFELEKKTCSISFNMDGLLDNDTHGVKPFVIQFLKRMESQNYDQRTNSDELRHFFAALDQLYNPPDKSNPYPREVLLAKIILLNENLWEIETSAQYTTTWPEGTHKKEPFDFSSQQVTCRAICFLYEKKLLTDCSLKQIITNNDIATAIDCLYKKKNLDHTIYQQLLAQPNNYLAQIIEKLTKKNWLTKEILNDLSLNKEFELIREIIDFRIPFYQFSRIISCQISILELSKLKKNNLLNETHITITYLKTFQNRNEQKNQFRQLPPEQQNQIKNLTNQYPEENRQLIETINEWQKEEREKIDQFIKEYLRLYHNTYYFFIFPIRKFWSEMYLKSKNNNFSCFNEIERYVYTKPNSRSKEAFTRCGFFSQNNAPHSQPKKNTPTQAIAPQITINS